MSNNKELQIIQLCDYMNLLKRHLYDKGQLTIFAASCLDWKAIIKDKELINKINTINNLSYGKKGCSK